MTILRMRIARLYKRLQKYTYSEYVILIALHGNNGITKVPPYYLTRTLPVVLFLNLKTFCTIN